MSLNNFSHSEQGNYVLYRRCILRRNFESLPFTAAMTTDVGESVINEVCRLIPGIEKILNVSLFAKEPMTLATLRRFYASGGLTTDPNRSNVPLAIITNETEDIVLNVNDREHMKISIGSSQGGLETLWHQVDSIDDYIQMQLPMAFHKKYGYLTSDLNYVGTGLTLETICHLPALHLTGFIKSIADAMTEIGVSITSLWGDFYLVKNQATLGRSELELVLLMTQVLERLSEKELAGRETLYESQGLEWKDRSQRALGILSTALTIEWDEATRLLSEFWAGLEFGWLLSKDANDWRIERMKVIKMIMPYELELSFTMNLKNKEEQQRRASILRTYAAGFHIKE